MMETKIITTGSDEAARLLRAGELVAVPTETVYGLAGNGLDEQAVEQIYAVKGRPAVKPLSLMVPDAGAMADYCDPVPPQALALARRFWPGPLTIVLRARDLVPAIVRAGGTTVGLRCPDHPLTLELLRLAGVPFAAPSANPSGQPSPKTAEQVRDYFDGAIAAVVDGGACGLGRESTLIDLSETPYRVLRQGALPTEAIADALVDEMQILGIAGPSGSGKTSAMAALEARGALTIDCDAVYHALLETDRELLDALDAAFPGTVEAGVLDRRRLAAIVFHDEDALRRLNAIAHGAITREVQRRLREHAMAGGTLAAIDASELFESPLASRCSLTIGVLASAETRTRRIMARDALTREEALQRIRAQRPDSFFREHCDVVLENDDDEATFLSHINTILEERLHHG